QEPVPDVWPVRGMVGRRSHDQGPPDGWIESDPRRGDQSPPRTQVLQRQWASPAPHQLRDDLRARPGTDVLLGAKGGEDRLHNCFLESGLRQGPPRDIHVVGSTDLRSSIDTSPDPVAAESPSRSVNVDVDLLVVGAGITGIYQLYRAREK